MVCGPAVLRQHEIVLGEVAYDFAVLAVYVGQDVDHFDLGGKGHVLSACQGGGREQAGGREHQAAPGEQAGGGYRIERFPHSLYLGRFAGARGFPYETLIKVT